MIDQKALPMVGLDTVQDKHKLLNYLRATERVIQMLIQQTEEPVETIIESEPIDLGVIRSELEHGGSHPLNVEGLLGVLSDAQNAGAVVSDTLPTSPPAANYPAGTIGVKPGTPDVFYYVEAGNPQTWQSLATTATNVVLTDTPQDIGPGASKVFKDPTTFDSPTADAVLIQPSSAPAAATQILRARTTGGASDLLTLTYDGVAQLLTRLGIGGAAAAGSGLQVHGTTNAIVRATCSDATGLARLIVENPGRQWQIRINGGAADQLEVRDNTAGLLRLSVTSAGLVAVAQALTVGTTLGVTGASTFTGAVQVNNTLGVTGASTMAATTLSGLLTANLGLTVNGSLSTLAAGLRFNTPLMVSADTTISAADTLVGVNTSLGVITVTLEPAPTVGTIHIIGDDDSNAAINNFVINGNGRNIRNSPSLVVNVNNAVVFLFYTGVQWIAGIMS